MQRRGGIEAQLRGQGDGSGSMAWFMGELLTSADARGRRNRSTAERSRRWPDGLVHGRAAGTGGCKGEEE
jgi:hypothetical protein